MVVLKKIKGSTLMETLVSSVLIIIVFMIASMVLNNMFSSGIKNNTHAIETKLKELHYNYTKGVVKLPYSAHFKKWTLSAETITENGKKLVTLEAFNVESKKRISKTVPENF